MPTPDDLHALIRTSTNPLHQAGYIGTTSVDHSDVEWILGNFGNSPAVWRGLLERKDLTQDWIERASRFPDASVMGRIITLSDRFTTRETVAWVRDYASELANTLESHDDFLKPGAMTEERRTRVMQQIEAYCEVEAYADRVLRRLEGDMRA